MGIGKNILWFGLILLLLAGCSDAQALSATDSTAAGPTGVPNAPIESARSALLDFFDVLHQGRFEEAARLYGGSYEDLLYFNPEIDPNDKASLWMNGCTFNGLNCLPVLEVVSEQAISPVEFHFVVIFKGEDGSPFVLGPCCGASEEDMPAQSEFDYSVVLGEDGAYRVQEMPVYTP